MYCYGLQLASTPSPDASDAHLWMLSLDTLIAGLGSIATIVLATLALVQTARVTKLQEKAHVAQVSLHEHMRRFRLHQAMMNFIDAKETSGAALDEHEALQLTAVENGFGYDAEELDWASLEAEENAARARQVKRDEKGRPVDHASWLTYVGGKNLLQRRLAHWVDTGEYRSSLAGES